MVHKTPWEWDQRDWEPQQSQLQQWGQLKKIVSSSVESSQSCQKHLLKQKLFQIINSNAERMTAAYFVLIKYWQHALLVRDYTVISGFGGRLFKNYFWMAQTLICWCTFRLTSAAHNYMSSYHWVSRTSQLHTKASLHLFLDQLEPISCWNKLPVLLC